MRNLIEDKDLLLKDLCMRLPYGVKIDNMGEPSMLISINHKYHIIVEIAEGDKNPSFNSTRLDVLEIEEVRPYLFPLSSMTDEQRKELYKMGWYLDEDKIYSCFRNYDDANYKTHIDCFELVNWCYKNNFDINGLIPTGLANDATGLNIY